MGTLQATLVFLLLSWCLLYGSCFGCHIGQWSLRKPNSIWPCFEDADYWQAAEPVYWSCLQCACAYEWCLSLGCFSHSSPVLIGQPDLPKKLSRSCKDALVSFEWSWGEPWAFWDTLKMEWVGEAGAVIVWFSVKGQERWFIYTYPKFFSLSHAQICPSLTVQRLVVLSCTLSETWEDTKSRFDSHFQSPVRSGLVVAISRRLASLTKSSLWSHNLPGASQMSSSPNPSSRSKNLCPVNDHTGFKGIHKKLKP